MTAFPSIQAGIVPAGFLALLLVASPAAATLRIPECDGLAAWAKAYERGAQWKPNELGTRHWFPPPFAAPETEALFGKPVLAWSVDEANELARALRACERPLRAANRFAERNDVNAMGTYAGTNVARYLAALAEARQAVPPLLAALAQAPASPRLLEFYAALAEAGTGRAAFAVATQTAGRLQGDEQVQARALIAALRDMPQAEIGPAVSAPARERVLALRGGVRDGVIADVAAMPANVATLQRLAAAPLALRRQYDGALGAEDFAAIDRAVARRRGEVAGVVEAEVVASIAAVPHTFEAFHQIDQRTDARLLALLSPEGARNVEAAAAAQRVKAGDALLAAITERLPAMPETQEALDWILGTMMPGIRRLPDSAAAQKARLLAPLQARHDEILAAVNRAEAGPLRGRIYQGNGGELEFVDRTRVFHKRGETTTAGTYTEERDGRVVLTINGHSTVLSREGRLLTGGQWVYRRTK